MGVVGGGGSNGGMYTNVCMCVCDATAAFLSHRVCIHSPQTCQAFYVIRGKGVSTSAEHGLEVVFNTGAWVVLYRHV